MIDDTKPLTAEQAAKIYYLLCSVNMLDKFAKKIEAVGGADVLNEMGLALLDQVANELGITILVKDSVDGEPRRLVPHNLPVGPPDGS